MQDTGSYFLDSDRNGKKFVNRYQMIDQICVSRGLVSGEGLELDLDSIEIFSEPVVATSSRRPRAFNKSTKKGTSDHLPIIAKLCYTVPG